MTENHLAQHVHSAKAEKPQSIGTIKVNLSHAKDNLSAQN